ncbi:MAG: DinB family protein [Candidatus Sungbacteria bacterium]|nr:DinB family protein [bacterium]MDZ4260543.1 DinB family protein [Candidatus Sungbacteria bacterium]
MTEKEMFLNSFEKEFETTMRVLNAYPGDKPNFRPHPQSRSALELAWNFEEEERLIVGGAFLGDVVYKQNTPPGTLDEVKREYQSTHRDLSVKLKGLPDTAFNEIITFGSGAEHPIPMRRGDALWLAVMDAVHHRGQFSVYIRMTGGKVPSIYEPLVDKSVLPKE